MRTKTCALVFLLVSAFLELNGRHTIYLSISTEDNKSPESAEVMVSKNDSTVYFAIADEPLHVLSLPANPDYTLGVTKEGYMPFETVFTCSADTVIDITLEKRAKELDEFVVEGRLQSTKTAGGEVFRLSKRAKECGDPFRALSEIPILNVNIANQTVATLDGGSPLVLINGKLVNSGIAPIDPKFIEKVEVTEVVSAKYLQMGIDKIINIHLKRDVPMYLFFESRNRHDIPFDYGFDSLPFEVGSSKFAVSGLVSYTYRHKNKTETDSHEVFDGTDKFLSGENTASMRKWTANLMLKWVPNKSNYFAASAVFRDMRNRMRSNSSGCLGQSYLSPVTASGLDKSTATAWMASAYHEHTFKDRSTLTSYFKYNQSYDESDNRYEESDEDDITSSLWIWEKLHGDHYTASVDYDTQDKPYGNIVAGNSFEYNRIKDRDQIIPDRPSIRIGLLSDYTHLSYYNRWKGLNFMVSGGLQFLSVNAAGDHNSYWRPRAAASLTYVFPGNQFMRLSYQLTNDLPKSWQLATFDTSTNPWLRIEGNPFLIPEMKHKSEIEYNKTAGKFRFNPYLTFYSSDKIIEQYIRNDGDMAIQSYRNNGTYMELQSGFNVVFRNNKLQAWIGGYYDWERFNGQSAKHSVRVKGQVMWDFGKFFLFAEVAWRNRQYSAISTTRLENPYEASFQLGWTPTKQLTIYACLPYFWGIRKNTTYINQGGYASTVTTRFKSESLRPWILIAWSLRKNSESKIADKMPVE